MKLLPKGKKRNGKNYEKKNRFVMINDISGQFKHDNNV